MFRPIKWFQLVISAQNRALGLSFCPPPPLRPFSKVKLRPQRPCGAFGEARASGVSAASRNAKATQGYLARVAFLVCFWDVLLKLWVFWRDKRVKITLKLRSTRGLVYCDI